MAIHFNTPTHLAELIMVISQILLFPQHKNPDWHSLPMETAMPVTKNPDWHSLPVETAMPVAKNPDWHSLPVETAMPVAKTLASFQSLLSSSH